ncbi:MAG: hypothetical protein AB3N11_11730 [Arenibacterium sp.]
MPAYNTTFELSIDDIDMIETALRDHQRRLNDNGEEMPDACPKEINELLGRLHNQKVHYRPRKGVYVGG